MLSKLALALLAAVAADRGSGVLAAAAPATKGTCPSSPARDSALLQTGQELSPAKRSAGAASWGRRRRITSDCGRRGGEFGIKDRNAACVVLNEDATKALLVRVPYGSHPGWDLPGGRMHSGEFACETAEREACEETGHQVEVLEKLSYNVFLCRIVAENVCRTPVDEGFLQKRWVGLSELDSLDYRADTWGDKVGLLRTNLEVGPSAPSESPQPEVPEAVHTDACGCDVCGGSGFSTTLQECVAGKDTAPSEACACWLGSNPQLGQVFLDSCGCRPCRGEGWSSRVGACAYGSTTVPSEACLCSQDAS